MLVHALIVAEVKGIKRRITQIEKPLEFTEGSVTGISRKLEWEIDKELITDHNCDYISSFARNVVQSRYCKSQS